jgi:hypothetical protein
MPLLRNLTKEEQEALIHKLKSRNRQLGDNTTDAILSGMVNKQVEKKLAKVSEEENFNSKNRYRL